MWRLLTFSFGLIAFGQSVHAQPIALVDVKAIFEQHAKNRSPVPLVVTKYRRECGCYMSLFNNEKGLEKSTGEVAREPGPLGAGEIPCAAPPSGGAAEPEALGRCRELAYSDTEYVPLGVTEVYPVRVGEVTFGHLDYTGFPRELYQNGLIVQNCSSEPITGNVTQAININVTVAEAYAMSTTVTNGGTYTVKVDYQVPGFGTVGGSAQFNKSIAHTEGRTTTETRVVGVTTTTNFQIPPPGKAIAAIALVYKQTGRVVFTAEAEFNGKVTNNSANIKLMSDFIPDSFRVWTVTGYIELPSISQSMVIYREMPFRQDLCAGVGDLAFSSYQPEIAYHPGYVGTFTKSEELLNTMK